MAKNTNVPEGLHIKLVNDPSIKLDLDKNYGVLKLPKAGNFTVTIEEYDKKIKDAVAKHTEAGKSALNKWEDRRKSGWSKEKLDENWKANEKQRDTNYNNTVTNINTDYKDINWVWVVAPKQITSSELSHNDSFSKGIDENGNSITFPKILEGGGMAYLEAFNTSNGPKGKKPFGIFVKAIGQPEILRVEWTDFEYNPLKGKIVAFGSEVLLHVYTRALYGQEVTINLFDEDIFKDDELNIASKSAFQREVDIHLVHPKEIGKEGVADTLTKADQSKTDNVIEKEHYIQKVTIEVKVDYAWMKSAGDHLKIYPTVKSLKTEKYFEKFSREFLEVAMNGTLYDTPKDITNKPVVVSQIETNLANFHPCQYNKIIFSLVPETEKEKKRTIFEEAEAVEHSKNLIIPIICPDVDHLQDYSITLNNLETSECMFHGKSNDHSAKTFIINKTPENFKNVNINGNTLNFKAAFNYHPSNDNIAEMTSHKNLEYIWPTSLPKDNNLGLELLAATCRYQKSIKILAYPDIKWTLDFRFGMKGPEQVASTNLPTYSRNKDENAKDPKSRYSDTFEKGRKAGRINTYGMEKRANGMELEFQLALKAEYNKGEEIELAEKYSKKIKKFLELLLKLKEGLDRLTNIDKVNSGHKNSVNALGKIGGKLFKTPIIGTIDYPAISVGGNWKAAINENTNEIYTDGRLLLRFNPLLKGDVSLDIIAAVSYVPAFGQAVKAIEIALNTAGAELNFLLTVFGQVNVEFEYALAQQGGSNLNLNGELGIKLVLSAKVKKDFSAVVFQRDIGFKTELSAEGYVVTSIKPKASIGHDQKGTFVEAKCDFMGINIICILSAKIDDSVTQYKDTYNILERENDFVKGKSYIIES